MDNLSDSAIVLAETTWTTDQLLTLLGTIFVPLVLAAVAIYQFVIRSHFHHLKEQREEAKAQAKKKQKELDAAHADLDGKEKELATTKAELDGKEKELAKVRTGSGASSFPDPHVRESFWDGITRVESLPAAVNEVRQKLAQSAKYYHWAGVFEVLAAHPDLVNSSRPGEKSLYTPLHQAAYGGAPVEVVQRLIDLGAWRTLQNSRGERAVDIAVRKGHKGIVSLLEPHYRRQVPLGILLAIQRQFHTFIRQRAGHLVQEHALRLPELEPLLGMENPQVLFVLPGKKGSFGYRLEQVGVEARLVVEVPGSFVPGAGQKTVITCRGEETPKTGSK